MLNKVVVIGFKDLLINENIIINFGLIFFINYEKFIMKDVEISIDDDLILLSILCIDFGI